MDKKQQLAKFLLDIKAFHFSFDRPFVWSSGIKSPVYTDNRKILSFPRLRNFVIEYFISLIDDFFPETQYIAGVATGALPYASIIADRTGLPMVYIRPKPKQHGLKNQVEGFVPPQTKVVVIEDLISTGGSSLRAIEALRDQNAEVLGLIAVFTYGIPASVKNFEVNGVRWMTLTDIDQLVNQAMINGLLTKEQADFILNWRQNPNQQTK